MPPTNALENALHPLTGRISQGLPALLPSCEDVDSFSPRSSRVTSHSAQLKLKASGHTGARFSHGCGSTMGTPNETLSKWKHGPTPAVHILVVSF